VGGTLDSLDQIAGGFLVLRMNMIVPIVPGAEGAALASEDDGAGCGIGISVVESTVTSSINCRFMALSRSGRLRLMRRTTPSSSMLNTVS
jgi:hypothetical protein